MSDEVGAPGGACYVGLFLLVLVGFAIFYFKAKLQKIDKVNTIFEKR